MHQLSVVHFKLAFVQVESDLNRDVLTAATVAHVQRLIDPFGPSRLRSDAADGIINDDGTSEN